MSKSKHPSTAEIVEAGLARRRDGSPATRDSTNVGMVATPAAIEAFKSDRHLSADKIIKSLYDVCRALRKLGGVYVVIEADEDSILVRWSEDGTDAIHVCTEDEAEDLHGEGEEADKRFLDFYGALEGLTSET